MTTIEIERTKKVDELEPKFKKFLSSEYPTVIDEISKDRQPELHVDYEELEAYDSDLAEGVVEDPQSYYVALQCALQSFDANQYPELDHALVRLSNIPNRANIRSLRGWDVYSIISIEGRVKKTTDVRQLVEVAAFRCSNCNYVLTRKQPMLGKMTETPTTCPNCEQNNHMSFDWSASHIVDFQRVDIEESPEGLTGGETPQSIPVYISGNITGRSVPGEHVTVTGLLEPEQSKQKTPIFDTRMRGSHIQRENEDFEDIEISDEDEKAILELSENPRIYQMLTDSIAPSIYGNESQKMATLMSLFGGVTKEVAGSYLRGDIHVLLVGDPGTAKSQILQYIHSVSPRGVYTSGKGTSSAGLTAAAVQEESLGGEKTWTLEAGALVLADKGIAAIDELDKMSSEDRSSLHEALEQQTVSIAKAGISATLKARCALISAANPTYGRFDQYEPLAEQIDLEPALVSRFDLIFTMLDDPKEETDGLIADHMLDSHQAGTDDETRNKVAPEIEQDFLRKYVAYARNNCRPKLLDEARDEIKKFYLNLRNEGRSENDPIPATARKLGALVRLAEASAKMRLSDVVEVQDAERAIDITKECMENVGMDHETGKFDADVLETGNSKSQVDRKKAIRGIVEDLEAENPDGVHIDEIIDLAKQMGFDETRVRDDIETLHLRLGDLLEVKTAHYRTN